MTSAAVEAYGWGVTLVVAGSVFAIGGAIAGKAWLSALGAAAMIWGFFCPWIDPGAVTGFELARRSGVSLIAAAAWSVPAGGAIAMRGAMKGGEGRGRAALGGLIGMAAIAYLTFRLAM